MLSRHARTEWLTILGIGAALLVVLCVVGVWYIGVVAALLAFAVSLFFRDPYRRTPTQRGLIVSPCDGRVSSIHEIEHDPALDGPAICIRVFISLLDVHITRSPCHGQIVSLTHKPGDHCSLLNPESMDGNESLHALMHHPTTGKPVIAMRWIAGMVARTIHCTCQEGDILQRGTRTGLIKLGSSMEIILPKEDLPRIEIVKGERVTGGQSIIARVEKAPVSETASTQPSTLQAERARGEG